MLRIDRPDPVLTVAAMNESQAPVWSFAQPDERAIGNFLARQVGSSFSYREVGETRDTWPAGAGYNLDHNRVRLGDGADAFAAASAALRAWRMFPAPWTRISPADAPIAEGTVVAMQAHAVGLWWLNACRIVYVLDETAPVRRFGFAYGTQPAHVEQGEERFSVERLADDSVWYDLRAFSRPQHWAVRLAKPLARKLQRHFVRDSQQAMQAAVADAMAETAQS